MDERTRKRERRTRQAHERLGTTGPACAVCGDRRPLGLQGHHLAKRQYGDETGILCATCHLILTTLQIDHTKQIFDPPPPLERIAHALENETDLFVLIAEKRREQAKWLFDYIRKSVPPDEEPHKSENHNSNPGDKKS